MIPLANADDYVKALPDRKLVVLLGLGHLPQEEAPKTSLVPVEEFLAANRSKISPKTQEQRNSRQPSAHDPGRSFSLRLQPSFTREPLRPEALVVFLEFRGGLTVRYFLLRGVRVKRPSIRLVRDLVFS